jgi:hypothetical protein
MAFAKAAAIRPEIVGHALQTISRDPDVSRALFEVFYSFSGTPRRGIPAPLGGPKRQRSAALHSVKRLAKRYGLPMCASI